MDNILSLLDELPAALISAEIDAGTSGVSAGVDLLGSDLADASIGLDAVDSVLGLGTGLGLDDAGLGLLDSLL